MKTAAKPLPRPSFGSIETRHGATMTTYRAVYRLAGKKQAQTFDTYQEAFDHLEEQAIGIRRGGRARDLSKPRTPFAEVAAAWLDLRPAEPRSSRARERAALNAFNRTFGATPIGDITRQQVQRWINESALSPKTIADYLQVIGQVCREAALDDYLPKGSPIGKGLHRLPTVERRIRFLSDKDVDRLLKRCRKQVPAHLALIHVAAHTGLRQGELLALTRKDYDGKRLLVSKSLAKADRAVKGTKTNKSRKVALTGCCQEVLDAHLAGHDYELIFCGRGGQPLGADNWRHRVWLPLTNTKRFKGLHFHDLRHSHCSSLLAAGWDVSVVAERLGHASVKMTLDVYGHVASGRQEALLEARGIRAKI